MKSTSGAIRTATRKIHPESRAGRCSGQKEKGALLPGERKRRILSHPRAGPIKRLFVIAVSTYGLVSCASGFTSHERVESDRPSPTESEIVRWSHLVGTWFGSQPEADGGRYDWIVVRDPYGRFKLTHRNYDEEGNFKENVEVGEWGVSGPVFFVIAKGWIREGKFVPIEHVGPGYRDAYQIISITEDKFEYRYYGDGRRFVVKRVPAGYTFEKRHGI